MDKNRDLYLLPVAVCTSSHGPKPAARKIASMVDAISWNETSGSLCAVVDGAVVIWYFPAAVFIDLDVFPLTTVRLAADLLTTPFRGLHSTESRTSDASNALSSLKQSRIRTFVGRQLVLRCADGAVLSVSGVDPYVTTLFELLRKNMWDEAVKLCRFAQVRSHLFFKWRDGVEYDVVGMCGRIFHQVQ